MKNSMILSIFYSYTMIGQPPMLSDVNTARASEKCRFKPESWNFLSTKARHLQIITMRNSGYLATYICVRNF